LSTKTPTKRTRMRAEQRREVIERVATELFAKAGYHATSMEEIASASCVTVPVVYDHFSSKEELQRRLLEIHFAELREIWQEHLPGDDPPDQRFHRAIDAWFSYVEEHPYAWRMLFRAATGEPGLEAIRREVAEESKQRLLPLIARQPGMENLAGADPESMEMAWEALRSLIQGLASWWYDHPEVPRERLVATAMNTVWIGFDRVRSGETWDRDAATAWRERERLR
jgi:AcrR family transcriptional regulator